MTIGALAVVNFFVARALGVPRWDFLRSGAETNLPTWYATIQLALIGLVLVPIVWDRVRWRRPTTWVLALPTVLFLMLSLDEAAMVHERVGLWLQSIGAGTDRFVETSPWLYVLAPIYGLIAVAAFRAWWPYVRHRPTVLALGVGGVLLLGACAAGLEGLMFLLEAQGTLLGRAMSVIEETGELIAATFILWAALRLVEAEGIRVVRTPPDSDLVVASARASVEPAEV